MRLLYLTMLDFPRRVANRGQIMNMCDGFSRHVDCTLVIAKSYLFDAELRAYYGVDKSFKIVTLGSWALLSRFFSLIRLMIIYARCRPDIIYVREEKLAYLLSFTPLTYIYEIHEVMTENTKKQVRAINKSRQTVAILDTLVEEMIERGAERKKFLVQNLAVKTATYDLHEVSRQQLSENRERKTKIVYSGRFSVQKGVFTLIEAMKHLPEDFILVFVGGFEGEAEVLEQFSTMQGVRDRIEIVGHVEHSRVHEYLKKSDILALPNSGDRNILRHTNPLKPYEYLAAGRPIVASRINEITSVIPEEIVNFFEPDSPKNLAEVITLVAKDTKSAYEKVERGRAFVASRSWDNRAGTILSALTE